MLNGDERSSVSDAERGGDQKASEQGTEQQYHVTDLAQAVLIASYSVSDRPEPTHENLQQRLREPSEVFGEASPVPGK